MKNTGNIAIVLCLCLAGYLMIEKLSSSEGKKVGVVQMEKLVYDFKGMKEASKKYALKIEKWGMESDSLEGRLKDLYTQIKLDSASSDREKLAKDIMTFKLYKRSLIAFNQNKQETAAKEDEKMTLGVINQINEYIKTYAENKGYDVVLCNSQNQSVGYAKEQIDITEAVLAFANSKYEGK